MVQSFIRKLIGAIALFFIFQSSGAQDKTYFPDKIYRIFDLQITYPSIAGLIFGFEKEHDSLVGESCSFIVSIGFADGSEERMIVAVRNKSSLALFQLLGADDKDILEMGRDITLDAYKSNPMYSHIKETNSVSQANYSYVDFSGRYFREKRNWCSSKAYYEEFNGRILEKLYGKYVVEFVMQDPSRNNFITLQRIANSLAYSY